MPQLIFGGILALILLGFYIWSIASAVSAARHGGDLAPNMAYLLNTIGGLISATVVGVLGATQAGEFPAQKTLQRNLTGTIKTLAGYMPSIFILVWMVCGVITVIYGFVLYDTVPPLSAQAKVWLGTAIGAVYAYMGVRPNSNSGKPDGE